MKNFVLTAFVLMFSLVSRGQCYPTPIYGANGTRVGDTTSLVNSISGGVWSISDSNIAVINSSSGRITGKRVGTVTISYSLPGMCRRFFSTKVITVTPGVRMPGNVCAGNTATISDSLVSSCVWTSADTNVAVINSATGVVRGVTTGMVMITCNFTRFGYACMAEKRLMVTRGINGRKKLFLADTVTYRDTVAGGAWHITDTSIAAVDSVTGLVRAKSLGRVFINYTNVIGGVACTAYDTIWVSKGLRGNSRICIGDTTTYQDSVAGGVWSSSDTTIAVINPSSGLLHSVSAGTAAITYTKAVLGTTFIITDSIMVAGAPTLAHLGSFSICSGTSGYFGSPGSAVTWLSYTPSVVSIYGSPVAYLGNSSSSTPASALIKYTSAYCSYVFDTLTITVNPRPYPGTISGGGVAICPHDSVALYPVGVTGGSWYCASSYVTVSTSGMVTALPTYTNVYADINHDIINSYGCLGFSSTRVYISAAPNPGTIAGLTTLNIGLIGNFSGTGSGTTDAWSVSPSSLASVSSTGQVTPLSVGTVSLKHIYYNSCGSDSVSAAVTITPPATGGSCSAFTGFVNSYCSSPEFGVSVFAHSTPYRLKTYYGQGDSDSMVLAASSGTTVTTYNHAYAATGSYTIKQVLYNASTPVDSVIYSYMHVDCNNVSLSFFMDVDHDCQYNAAIDHINYSPVQVIVDSNGVAIDTLSVTGGLYYQEYGNYGDIFGFRLLSPSATISCPSTGIVYDTLSGSMGASRSKAIGITCTSSGFDVMENTVVANTGRHTQLLDIHVGNTYCTGEDAVVTLNFDSRYNFNDAYPYPSSITGSTARWTFSNISNISGIHPDISVHLETSGGTSSWITPRTPIYSTVTIAPATGGDLDTTNNTSYQIDTVKASFDPNFIHVAPMGNILNGTKLHYTIQFENDGNDTARNIYVMDTLPDYVNVSSLRIVTATHKMNTSITHYGGHNIIKFDFPNIMLADSSHHLHCTGSVMFNVNANYGVANGTHIDNHAGIFFDDNPVVMTDTSHNVILIPSLVASSTCHDTMCRGGLLHCDATFTTINTPHYQWYKNTSPVGTDSTGFTGASVVAGDSIKCVMRTIMDDTVYTISNILHIIERALPYPGTISGTSAVVCPGNMITLTDSVAGGTWGMAHTRATVTGGVVTGVTSGYDTALYTVTNICYPNTARFPFLVHALPDAGTISGFIAMCDTSAITLTDTVAGGTWYLSNTHAAISATGRVTGISGGSVTAFYRYTNMCGSDTASLAITVDSLVPLAVPAGPSSVCQGFGITLTGSVAGGAWSVANSHASVTSAGVVSGVTGGADTVIYTIVNTCGNFHNSKVVTVNPTLVPTVNVGVTPAAAICEGDSVVLTAAYINGGATPSFMWEKFGVAIGSGASMSYVPSIGDIVICKMVSNALCRSVDTVANSATMAVNPAVTPVITIVATPSDSIAYSGQLISFYSTTTYGGTSPTYQWYVNNVAVPGATSISYSRNVTYNDTIRCEMVSNASCVTSNTVASNSIVIYADYLAVHGLSTGVRGISLFPNPNNGIFTLSGQVPGSNDAVGFDIMDITGKVVYSDVASPVNGAINVQVNLKGLLAPGQYMVRVVKGADVAVMHFVID